MFYDVVYLWVCLFKKTRNREVVAIGLLMASADCRVTDVIVIKYLMCIYIVPLFLNHEQIPAQAIQDIKNGFLRLHSGRRRRVVHPESD